jgi:hypothetical protein
MIRNKILLCSLLFAFVLSFSFGFHTVLQAGNNPRITEPEECSDSGDIGHCCEVNEATGQMGVCVWIGPGVDDVVCECTCLHVAWPTCDGPEGCEYDLCPIGGGS